MTALREAEALGVFAEDAVTPLGEALLTSMDAVAEHRVADLAGRVASLIADTPGSVTLQSDLTAVASGREVPQPLQYLVGDVARRHGRIRVRTTLSCVVAEEAAATEILHTRSLPTLRFTALAPTVLTSRCEAGPAGTLSLTPPVKLAPAELARRLRAHRDGGRDRTDPQLTSAFTELAALNPALDESELELLADALKNSRDVVISYRNKSGNVTAAVPLLRFTRSVVPSAPGTAEFRRRRHRGRGAGRMSGAVMTARGRRR